MTLVIFLYDDSSLLYRFILNKEHKYFYLRDAFGNILGILDEKKSLIVKYKYNAWGEITEIISDSDTDIGELNPFKFNSFIVKMIQFWGEMKKVLYG